tara:strand:- start:13 stop:195 length:183 start_codon:yes stop_codon:yes gene_type:complete
MRKRNSICEREHDSNIANVALANNYCACGSWSNVNKKIKALKISHQIIILLIGDWKKNWF